MTNHFQVQTDSLQKLASQIREDIDFINHHQVDYPFLAQTVDEDLSWLRKITTQTDIINRQELGEFYDIFIYQLRFLLDSRPSLETLDRLEDLLDETYKQLHPHTS